MTHAAGEDGSVADIFALYRVPIILGSVSLLLIVVAIVLLIQSTRSVAPIEFSSDATASAVPDTLIVDVRGAVELPGVYTLPVGSRVDDALVLAGGLTRDADDAYVDRVLNRAGKLTDGAKLFIPRIGELDTSAPSDQSVSGSTGESMGMGVVSVNTASQAELESLPGIGPVTAQKIMTNRPYLTIDELVTRNILRPSLYEELKTSLSL